MDLANIEIINNSNNPLPHYQTAMSAGMDLHAWCDSTITIQPGQRHLIGTGLHIALPAGLEAQIRPRSGLALKHGISVVNTPGTVDADYRGEIKVLLINHGNEPFEVNNGDRIAQMVINQYVQAQWKNVSELNATERGEGGYGSSGK